MTITTQQLIDDAEQLVSLPEACIRLNELVADPRCSTEEIGRVINQDVALTARILRIANSPMYGLATQVDTISRAVMMLGTEPIRNLALATTAVKTFSGIPNTLISMDQFWEHSIYCALCARTLAMDCLKQQREAVFVGGLLHDIGRLLMYHQEPELSRQALESRQHSTEPWEHQDAERAVFGFDHAELGGELAKRWGLPNNLYECIAFHHAPAQARTHPVEVAIVHIANSLASLAQQDTLEPDQAPAIQPLAWELTGLDTNIIEAIVASAQAQIGSARALLMISR
jgi:putative nucleotidyltransferase with HDIG domain